MGSSKEREDLLRRYEIYDVLDELLLQEKRFSDLFRLRCDLGDLDGALELTLRGKQIGPLVDVEEQIQQLTDHVVTGRLLDNLKRRKKISDKILGDLKKSATTEQQKRVREWSLAINCLESDDGLSVSKIGLIHSDLMRLVIALQVTNYHHPFHMFTKVRLRFSTWTRWERDHRLRLYFLEEYKQLLLSLKMRL